MVHSETDAASAVLEGLADAALGLRALAERYRLAFVPVMRERFDLLIDRRACFEPPLQKLIQFCGSPAFSDKAASLSGYEVQGFGTVHFNG
jgi:molybdate-binding protein